MDGFNDGSKCSNGTVGAGTENGSGGLLMTAEGRTEVQQLASPIFGTDSETKDEDTGRRRP